MECLCTFRTIEQLKKSSICFMKSSESCMHFYFSSLIFSKNIHLMKWITIWQKTKKTACVYSRNGCPHCRNNDFSTGGYKPICTHLIFITCAK